MGCTQTAEIVALHGTGETLTDRGARHVDELARQEVVSRKARANRHDLGRSDAELDDLVLRLDLRHGEVAALGLGRVLHLGKACTELERGIAILVRRAVGDDLAVVEQQHRHRDVLSAFGEDAGHPHLLCNHTGTHRAHSSVFGSSCRP